MHVIFWPMFTNALAVSGCSVVSYTYSLFVEAAAAKQCPFPVKFPTAVSSGIEFS